MTKIDIIIPIYNAFEDLQTCLESVYKYTDLDRNRLILINDNSPDERVREYLEKQRTENVLVIHNEHNLGFSNSINLGMSQSEDRDVILLNSDTIVSAGWVEKMVSCAYSDKTIGTVTPLSNNATLCSVPDFCEENSLPDGMSVEQAAEIVEACSLRRYPRITVAHGFCMLIKREVIACVGNFDAMTFGRGYGEENDFCNRAEQMGYIHVMCDDVYIYHSGTKSFVSKEKEKYIEEHDKILYERYPEQMHANAVHCRDNPNGYIGKNIGLNFDIRNGRKNVLFLLQSDFREGADDHIGGTQLHVKHLTQQLRAKVNVFVAARDKEVLQVTAYLEKNEHVFRFFIGKAPAFPTFYDRVLSKVFETILKGFAIDLVHVHHTITTSLDIFYESERLGIPVLFTAHDFYSVCPCIKLLDANGSLCIHNKDTDCAKCLRARFGIYEKNEFILKWRREYENALKRCQMVFVPSASAGEILQTYYPGLGDKIRIQEHGMDHLEMIRIDDADIVYTDQVVSSIAGMQKKELNTVCIEGCTLFQGEVDNPGRVVLRIEDSEGNRQFLPTNFPSTQKEAMQKGEFECFLPEALFAKGELRIKVLMCRNNTYFSDGQEVKYSLHYKTSESDNFRVAFIGGISTEKGGKTVSEVIRRGPQGIDWYVFGGIGDENLAALQKTNLLKTGYYHTEDLPAFLQFHEIDAICILPKWPETFSYTLSEAILNKVPVIVTDVGALGQRVREIGCGQVVSLDEKHTVQEVLDCLEQWKNKTAAYKEIKAALDRYTHPTIQQMADAYQNIYAQYPSRGMADRTEPDINNMILRACTDIRESHFENEQMLEKIEVLQAQLQVIENSLTYKMVRKITGLKFPLKKQIREFILNIRHRGNRR